MAQKKSSAALWVSLSIAAIVVIVAAVLIFSPHHHAAPMQPVPGSSSGAKFSTSSYASYAYMIYPTMGSNAQAALSGFKLEETNNSDGTTTVKLVATNPSYQTQSYTLKKGDTLYFLERSLRDDSGTEHFLADDQAVVVNSSGYITQGPGSA